MKQALGGMQDLMLLNPDRLELGEHVLEIPGRGFVGAAVLGGVDGVEIDAELFVAEREALVVDVRQDHEFKVPLQVLKRRGCVGECRPVADRPAVSRAIAPADRNAPFLGEAPINDREQVAIELGRRLDLLRGFMARVRLENFIPFERPRRLAGQGLQGFDHTRFPVDQRAVAIEGQGVEVGELRRRPRARC